MADHIVVRFRDQEYDFELRVSTVEARIVKKLTKGMGVTEWLQGILRRGDPDALMSLVYLCKKRAGETVVWKDFDEVDVLGDVSIRDADVEETDDGDDPALAAEDDGEDEALNDEDEAQAPDPTPPGPTRKSGSASTSSSSRSSSRSTRGTSTA